MTPVEIVAVAIAATSMVVAGVLFWRQRRGPLAPANRRILFPFSGSDLSRDALDAALRLANAEHATLVPAYLAAVPLHLPLDAPIPRECETAIPMLETIEQRAARAHVEVDSRIESWAHDPPRPHAASRRGGLRLDRRGCGNQRIRRLRIRRHTLAHRQRRGRARGPAPLQVRAAALWERNARRARLSGTELESGRIEIS